MAIKPIGSSLIARAPGTLTRKREEQNINKPPIPGKGDIGTVQRGLIQEPNIQTIPGSEKVIRVAPGAESTSQILPGLGNKDANILPGVMGQSVPAGAPAGANAPTPAMFQNMSPNAPTSAGSVAKGGVAPRVLGASSQNTAPIRAAGVQGGQMNEQASGERGALGILPTLFSFLSGRSSAGGDNPNVTTNPGMGSTGVEVNRNTGKVQSFTPTTLQKVAGQAGQTINKVAPNSQLGKKLQTYGGAVGPAATGQGSISNVLRSVAQAVSNPINTLRSALSKLKFW